MFEFMGNVIDRLKQHGRTGTARNYSSALYSFRRFRRGEDISLSAIDHLLMEDYEAWMRRWGLLPNSTSFYMRILRAVYNRAIDQGFTVDRRPFRTVFTGTEKTIKRAISVRAIRRIKNLDLSGSPRLKLARDIFIFLFLCRGMSFIDAAYLRKSDICGGTLTYRRHKTGQLINIKIVKPIEELIKRYSSDKRYYLLPLIRRTGVEERQQYETALRGVNNSLKEIGEMIHLPIPLTTYVSRHTWATVAKIKNIPVSVISDALGHDSVSTTQIYLASIDTSIIDKANDLVINELKY